MKRKLALAVSILVGMSLISGCASTAQSGSDASQSEATQQSSQQSTSESTQSPAASDTKAELRMSWWGSQSRHDATVEAINVFMEKNPEITVLPEYQGWDGYHDKLVTQIASSTEPDVFQFDNYRYIADFASSGKLFDLAEYVGSTIDLSSFPADALLWGQYEGVQYGVPTGMNGSVCMYNKALFDQAGIEYPKDDWTWEDFEAAGKAIHAIAPDIYGIKEVDWYTTSIIIRQSGVLIGNEKSELQDFKSQLTTAYDMFNSWRESGIMPPLETSAAKDTQQDNLFLSGKAAMNIKSIAQLPMDQGSMKDNNEIGVVMVPGSKDNPSVFMEGAMPLTVGINSKYKDQAAQLINFIVNDNSAGEKLMTVRGVPCSEPVREHITPTLGDGDLKVFSGVDTLIEFGKGIDYYWTIKGNAQIGVILDEEKDNTGYGVKTTEQAATDAYDRIVKAVEEAAK